MRAQYQHKALAALLSLVLVFVGVSHASAVPIFHICDAPGNQSAPALFGHEAVWVDGRNGGSLADIYYADLNAGTSRAIAEDQFRAFGPKLSAAWITWGATSSDAPSGVRFLSRAGASSGLVPDLAASFWRFGLDGDLVAASDAGAERIVVHDLKTGAQTTVLTGPSPSGARIEYPWMVWSEGEGPRFVVAYNLQTAQRFAITKGSNSLSDPDISGTRVVWQDVTANAIRMKDLATGQEITIASGSGLRQSPAIAGNWVVWQDCRNGDFDIYGYHIPTGTEVPIQAASGHQETPALSAEWIAWTDDSAGLTDIDGCRIADVESEYGLTGTAAQAQQVYRFYNVVTGAHFYTSSAEERDTVLARWPEVFQYEGVAYSVNPDTNTQPLYRFYNFQNGCHFYTASSAERDSVISKWPSVFAYEGETYGVSSAPSPGCTAVFRFYNTRNGGHFYTASEEERDIVIARWPSVYTYEGVAFWLAP